MSKLLETAPCSVCDRTALIVYSFDEYKYCNWCHEELVFDLADVETLELLAWSLTSVA